MTTASEIVTRAMREGNLLPLVSSPSTAETTEGLSLLNSLIQSTLGNEAGTELNDLQIGGTYDQSSSASTFVPANSRLVLELSTGRALYLNPRPDEGERVAIADAGANLASANLVLNGNGRRIETAASVTLSTNSLARQWMYRADTGNWVKVTDLIAADTMPFPTEFDDYFIVSLAVRLAPRHSAKIGPESIAALERSRNQIRARYRKRRPQQDMGSVGLLNSCGRDIGSSDLLR